MPLPQPTVSRELVHTRRVRFEAYKRVDGLWDVEAHLTDIKPQDFELASGVRPAGVPAHDMWLRLTIDAAFNIVDAAASTDQMPYPPYCEAITPAYRNVIGLNLAHHFRLTVLERFGVRAGCTHLTELLVQFPTAAIQALAGERHARDAEAGHKPFQLDRCHALVTDGEAVRRYYPRWYRSTAQAEQT
jgi:hypothetical protein